MGMKYKAVLFLTLAVFLYPCKFVLAADSSIVITSYYPSPNVYVYDFFANTKSTVNKKITINANGDFSVGDNSGPTIMTICDAAVVGSALCPAAGMTVKKDAFIDTISVYGCNSGSCTGGVNVSNKLEVVNFGTAANPAYIALAGVPLKQVPVLYFPPGGDTTIGASSGYDYATMATSIENCYLGPASSLDTCLAALNPITAFRNTLSGPCASGECSSAKAIYKITKSGEVVAGLGVGIELGSSNFGLGVAILIGVWPPAPYTNNYASFQYQIKDP